MASTHSVHVPLYEVMFDIKGLHDVLKVKDDKLEIDCVVFNFDGENRRGIVTVDSDDEIIFCKVAKQYVSSALSKIIFAYNTEAFVSETGFYFERYSK